MVHLTSIETKGTPQHTSKHPHSHVPYVPSSAPQQQQQQPQQHQHHPHQQQHLSHHPEHLTEHHVEQQLRSFSISESSSVYGSRYAAEGLPKCHIPQDEMPPRIAYKLIKDEIAMDGSPFLNLASFVTTYMEPEAESLMAEAANKNFIDYEEYPATCDIQNRCVAMVGNLFNVPSKDDGGSPLGVTTVGSSEAIMLAVLAMKKRWQNRRKAEGKDWHHPNIVMGANVQVCWEKAARYFEIDEKYVYATPTRYCIDPAEAVELVDENTIGICAILGSTYTGEYEDVQAIDKLLQEKNKKYNFDCGIHVDAASGGFVAPFVCPELVWDFRLPTVVSINASGHKYGLVYPGIGLAVWRSSDYLPKELIFNINYLGADQASFTLNFSKGASQVIAMYYQLVRLGRSGYTAIMTNLTAHATYLYDRLVEKGDWVLMSSRGKLGLPLVAFRLKEQYNFDEYDIARELRSRQWTIPAYTMCPNASHIKLLRIVIREDFTHSRCDLFLRDLQASVDHLMTLDKKQLEGVRVGHSQRKGGSIHIRHTAEAADHDRKGGSHPHSLQGKHGKSHNVC